MLTTPPMGAEPDWLFYYLYTLERAQAQRRLPFTPDHVAQGRSDRRRNNRVRTLQQPARFDQPLQVRAETDDPIGVVSTQGRISTVGQMQRDSVKRRSSFVGQAQLVIGKAIDANPAGH